MKKTLLAILSAMLLPCGLQAQDTETHVTVHAGEAALETLLTEEQKQSVTNLTVTGTLLEEDYAFLRNKLYPLLDTLNLRAADIDTLPNISLEVLREPNYNKIHLILPISIEHIGTNFLSQFSSYYSLEVTGKFPTFGKCTDSPQPSDRTKVALSDDNFSYETILYKRPNWMTESYYSSIYSSDGDIFYYMNMDADGEYAIKEGTKIIHETAFRNLSLPTFTLILPASLDSIGDYAFERTQCPASTGYYDIGAEVVCYAIEPPKLGKDVFKESVLEQSLLYVPQVSIEKYKNTEGWNQAPEIRAIETHGDLPPSRISTQTCESKVSIKPMTDYYELDFSQEPLYIKTYSTSGMLPTKQTTTSSSMSIDRKRLASPYTIVRVYFANHTTETIKLIP